jgi:gluconolactonase
MLIRKKNYPSMGGFKFEDGKAKVLTDTLKSPNGIGLSPDHKVLYVSDSETGKLHCYELDDAGNIVKEVNFFTVQEVWDLTVPSNLHGWDGMAVSKKGVILAAGFGGVWFFFSRSSSFRPYSNSGIYFQYRNR